MAKPPTRTGLPARTGRAGVGGRPPKPTQLHKLQGTYQPSRHDRRAAEPSADGELEYKPAPDWLTEAQRNFWCETLLDAPRDVLRRIDWAIFTEYVLTWDRFVTVVLAQRKLDQGQPLPFLIKGHHGPALSPYLRTMNHCILLLSRLQSEMGFTPAARVRLATPMRDDEADDFGTGWDTLRKLRVIDGGKE